MQLNYHIHTKTSVDAEGDVFDYCKKAFELGFKEICFTNHHDWKSVDDRTYNYAMTEAELTSIFSDIQKAKNEFPHLAIKAGIELGYFREWEKEIIEFPKKYPFDYVMMSFHWFRGELLSGILSEPKSQEYAYRTQTMFPKISLKEKYRQYFKELNRVINLKFFDCIGHFDIIKKMNKLIPLENHKKEVMECIKSMKKHDIGVELNTMGWEHMNKECYPSVEILELMQKAGIRKVTIGSDCHHPEDLDYGIKKGMKLLKDIGFREICTFDKRKAKYHKLP